MSAIQYYEPFWPETNSGESLESLSEILVRRESIFNE